MRPFYVLSGCDAADSHVRTVVVVCPVPVRGAAFGLLDGFDDVLTQPLLLDGADATLDTGVPLRRPELEIQAGNSSFIVIYQFLASYSSGCIVAPEA